MTIVMNEMEYAEKAIKESKLGNNPAETLGRVIKYYLASGYSKADTTRMAEEFLLRCDSRVNFAKWRETIATQVRNVGKYPPIVIDKLVITKQELEIVDALATRSLQKLLFTLICVAKYWNKVNPDNNNWVNIKDRELFRLADLRTGVERQCLMIKQLRDMGYLTYSKKVDNLNLKVECLDTEETEPALEVTDLRSLGNQYKLYKGDPYILCQECGLVTKRKSNRQKYCADCAVKINIKKTAENTKARVSEQKQGVV